MIMTCGRVLIIIDTIHGYLMYNRNINIEERNENNIQMRSKSSKKFIINKPNIEAYKRSIVYSGASKWNALKTETKNIGI